MRSLCGSGWVWNASVQVTQEGQWATLTAGTLLAGLSAARFGFQ